MVYPVKQVILILIKNFILLFVLLAFAGNSVLNRLALKGGHIDAERFTIIRLSSGAILLALLVLLNSGLAKFTRKELGSVDFCCVFFQQSVCSL